MTVGGSARIWGDTLAEAVARRSQELALVLVRAGADLVVVGGTARALRGQDHRPFDLDVAVRESDVVGLVDVLRGLGLAATVPALRRARPAGFDTGWGHLDVFVVEEPPACRTVVLEGTPVKVEETPTVADV